MQGVDKIQRDLFNAIVEEKLPHSREDIQKLRKSYDWEEEWRIAFKDLRAFNLFVLGFKPALYLSKSELFPYLPYLKQYYITNFEQERVLVTKLPLNKELYFNIDGSIGSDSNLGRLLGFPEIAVKDYEEGGELFGVDYNGLVFTCKFEHIQQSIKEIQDKFSEHSQISQGVYLIRPSRFEWERVVNM